MDPGTEGKRPLEGLSAAHFHEVLVVIDTSGGCGASFDIEIASAAFEGKRLLERHRVVNTALNEELKEIHALSIRKALTPEQWQEQNPTTVAAT